MNDQLTDAEVVEARTRHQPRHSFRDPEGTIPQDWCDDCDSEYPCDAYRLLGTIAAQTAEIERLITLYKRGYCAEDRFDTCGDPFCVEARGRLENAIAPSPPKEMSDD